MRSKGHVPCVVGCNAEVDGGSCHVEQLVMVVQGCLRVDEAIVAFVWETGVIVASPWVHNARSTVSIARHIAVEDVAVATLVRLATCTATGTATDVAGERTTHRLGTSTKHTFIAFRIARYPGGRDRRMRRAWPIIFIQTHVIM